MKKQYLSMNLTEILEIDPESYNDVIHEIMSSNINSKKKLKLELCAKNYCLQFENVNGLLNVTEELNTFVPLNIVVDPLDVILITPAVKLI